MEINNIYGIYDISNVISIVLWVLIVLKAVDYTFFRSLKDS